MPYNQWGVELIGAQVAGAALANTTTPTSLIPSAARLNFPSNVAQVGSKFKVFACGIISSAAAPGTITFDFRVGSVLLHSVTTGTLVASQSNVPWWWELDLRIRSIGGGTGATMFGASKFTSAVISAATPILLSAPAVSAGFDSTAAAYLDLFGTWSLAAAADSVTLDDYSLFMAN